MGPGVLAAAGVGGLLGALGLMAGLLRGLRWIWSWGGGGKQNEKKKDKDAGVTINFSREGESLGNSDPPLKRSLAAELDLLAMDDEDELQVSSIGGARPRIRRSRTRADLSVSDIFRSTEVDQSSEMPTLQEEEEQRGQGNNSPEDLEDPEAAEDAETTFTTSPGQEE